MIEQAGGLAGKIAYWRHRIKNAGQGEGVEFQACLRDVEPVFDELERLLKSMGPYRGQVSMDRAYCWLEGILHGERQP